MISVYEQSCIFCGATLVVDFWDENDGVVASRGARLDGGHVDWGLTVVDILGCYATDSTQNMESLW